MIKYYEIKGFNIVYIILMKIDFYFQVDGKYILH